MFETKKWYESKGVWGALVTVIAAAAGLIGYQVTPDDQQAIIGNITGIVTAVGGIVAWLGRVKATKVIG